MENEVCEKNTCVICAIAKPKAVQSSISMSPLIWVNHVGIVSLFDVQISNVMERVLEVGFIQYGELCL